VFLRVRICRVQGLGSGQGTIPSCFRVLHRIFMCPTCFFPRATLTWHTSHAVNVWTSFGTSFSNFALPRPCPRSKHLLTYVIHIHTHTHTHIHTHTHSPTYTCNCVKLQIFKFSNEPTFSFCNDFTRALTFEIIFFSRTAHISPEAAPSKTSLHRWYRHQTMQKGIHIPFLRPKKKSRSSHVYACVCVLVL